jgi:hypothetical protein
MSSFKKYRNSKGEVCSVSYGDLILSPNDVENFSECLRLSEHGVTSLNYFIIERLESNLVKVKGISKKFTLTDLLDFVEFAKTEMIEANEKSLNLSALKHKYTVMLNTLENISRNLIPNDNLLKLTIMQAKETFYKFDKL